MVSLVDQFRFLFLSASGALLQGGGMAENVEAATVAVAAFGALDEGQAAGAFDGEVSRPAARSSWNFLSSQTRVWLRSARGELASRIGTSVSI